MKFNKKSNHKVSKAFTNMYPHASSEVINTENFVHIVALVRIDFVIIIINLY